VEAYQTVDAMLSYRINEHLDLRLNVSNLNDAFYFDRLGGGDVVPAPPRHVLFTTNFRL